MPIIFVDIAYCFAANTIDSVSKLAQLNESTSDSWLIVICVSNYSVPVI